MEPADVLADFDPLDALEQNIENAPIPGDAAFHDPLCGMLDKLEQGLEASEVRPPLVPEGSEAPENSFHGHSPQVQGRRAASERRSVDSPLLPYYLEDPQQNALPHAPPYHPGGRIGRRGGRSSISSHAAQSDQTYCPIKKDFVSVDSCEDCEYYVEDSDSEIDWRCSYHDEENL